MTLKRIIPGALLAIALVSLSFVGASAAPLSEAREKAVREATFEIVARKPESDPLTYERPLPLDQLPYSVRSDAHVPIGTAFAIGKNEYVSAAHVIQGSFGSMYGPPQVRDRRGRIWDIAQITRYSHHDDFVVFSLRDAPTVRPLRPNLSVRLNTTVFAVGNALGEGIVMRDGLYTSNTPEDFDGAWSWIRFSAAASPGSSGGPLLDRDGRVIGVVTASSPAENLNYALPISRVLSASTRKASIKARDVFRIPILAETATEMLDKEIDLPKSYADFSTALLDVLNRQYDRRLDEFLAAHRDEIFPHGDKSAKLLHMGRISGGYPLIIVEGESGDWEAQEPYGRAGVELSTDGYVTTGLLGGATVLQLWNPNEVTVEQLLSDSRRYMDLALRGLQLTRAVGEEVIRITSLGEAATEAVHVDAWGRKWQIRTWPMPYEDVVVLSFALPLPGGCAAMIRMVPPAQLHIAMRELSLMTDFFYLSYTSKLAKWQEFLHLEAWRPAMFDSHPPEFEYGRFLRYRSSLFEFQVPSSLLAISDTTQLSVVPKFIGGDGAVRMEVAALNVMLRKDRYTHINVARRPHPAELLGKDWQNAWDQLVKREPPYDGSLHKDRGTTSLRAYVPRSSPEANVYYEIMYTVDVDKPEKQLRRELATAVQGFKLFEH